MLNRKIVLTSPDPYKAAQIPAAGEARVERQRAVNQPDHSADILAEICEHEGGVGEDARIVFLCPERQTSKIDGFAAACLRCFGEPVNDEPQVADRRPGQCRPVMTIDRDCLLKQCQAR